MPDQPRLIAAPAAATDPEADTRRAEYHERLRAALQDPAFRAAEGFPIADDEAILALSDPPYYTACPNPFLPEILEEWRMANDELRMQNCETASTDSPFAIRHSQIRHSYHREPFAADVSEGKNDPIYNAHSYHTKVPHKAIMRYILHYTEPGDVVFDGFCGTGMTGVAAQLCGDRKAVQALGYYVDEEGNVFDRRPATDDRSSVFSSPLSAFSRLGARRAVLVDLSPAATFIAYNYNTPVDMAAFEREAQRILREVEAERGWMYETQHAPGVKGKINYTVWSEVFSCPNCGAEVIFYDAAVDKESFRVNDTFECHACHMQVEKRSLDRIWETYYDDALEATQKRVKYAPVLINYQVGGRRFEKTPDLEDLRLLQTIEATPIKDWYPSYEMPEGERKGKDGYHLKGISHIHHFYFRRALLLYSRLWQKVREADNPSVAAFLRFYVEWICPGFTKMNRYSANHYSQVNRYFSGTLFVGSLVSEVSPSYAMPNKLARLAKLQMPGKFGQTAVSCQSTTSLPQLPDNVFDYVFIDPPFGNNLHYSELNFFWEAWQGILTERQPEAVMDKERNRTLFDYQTLMVAAFKEVYRVLKPGRWVTVEFHNSQNRVWNAIQEAMLRAGFVVADVRTLDKQQETYKQSIQQLVKQDLVISAYKPNDGLEERFRLSAGTPDGAWDFVRQHLGRLPVVVTRADGALEILAERQPFLLFDRMVAFHIQRGAAVPLSAAAFYQGLRERFIERDGMVFLPEQVPAYDRARLEAQSVAQLTFLVSDEKTALQWLRQQLNPALGGQPQSYQQLQPQFLKQLHQAKHEALPELNVLLEQNFIPDEVGLWRVPDPAKAADLETLRRKALLREFAIYLGDTKRLRQFRTEAIRTGFADAWQRKDYPAIIQVAERLPESVLQEDPELLMYYDNATLRVGAQA